MVKNGLVLYNANLKNKPTKKLKAKEVSVRSSSQHQTTKSMKNMETSDENLAHFGGTGSILTRNKSSDIKRSSEERKMSTVLPAVQ